MSILIKDISMPENCYQCRFYNSPCAQCRIIGRTYMNTSNQPSIRPEWCPVVEVPTPHGRLIDADELLMDANKLRYGEGWLITVENIEAAPTVIDAEGPKE